MNTQVKTALLQLAEGIAITAILAGIVAVASYLQSNTGQVNWKDVLVVFGVAFVVSAAHSLTAYLKAPPFSGLPLQWVKVAPPDEPAVQPVQNVATTTYTAAINTASTKTAPLTAKPIVTLPNAPVAPGSTPPEAIPRGVDEYKQATGEIPVVQA